MDSVDPLGPPSLRWSWSANPQRGRTESGACPNQRIPRLLHGHRKKKDSLEPFSNRVGASPCSFRQLPQWAR
jgi:hypothetical protein